MTLPAHVREQFGLCGPASALSGGTVAVYRVGDVVLKQIHASSLENQHSRELAPWLAGHLASMPQTGFRIPRPRPTREGAWMTAGGWMASGFLEGRPPSESDLPAVVEAARALHRALRGIPQHPQLDANETAWGVAHRHCWGERPAWVHPQIAPLAEALYDRLRPLPDLPAQLIHGDLNAENILIAPGQPPGFLDLTPFWAPADFALAMLANWLGPRRGRADVLWHFRALPHFDQLLLRAALRMLLVVSELRGVDDWRSERRAAEIVLDCPAR